jgi:predicted thioesterase
MLFPKGLSAESRIIVTEELTAATMGSGDMAVFATPAMIALMENAAMKAVAPALEEGQTTVGTAISTSHLRPSALGAEICAKAELIEVDGRALHFSITAYDGDRLIGEGRHSRFIVDKERFLAKLA